MHTTRQVKDTVSKVTLAALKSEDGHGGCFIEIDKIVHFRHPSLQTTIAIHNFNRHRGYSCFAGEYHTKDKPLFHRAGTLQEALFAPHVLYFGSKEIAFRCRRLLCCQCERVVEVVTGGDTPKQLVISRLASALRIRIKFSRAGLILLTSIVLED
jgi:hypothetical protein